MYQLKTKKEIIKVLEEGGILVYKPYKYRPTFLLLKEKGTIICFNTNLRYSIHYDDIDELVDEFEIFIYEVDKPNDTTIDEEYKYIRQ